MQGRCSGCGKIGPEREIIDHAVGCPHLAALPLDKVHNPAMDYQLWVERGRKAEQHARRDAVIADTDARREAMAARFSTHSFEEELDA